MDYSHIFEQDMLTLPWELLDLIKRTPYFLEKQKIVQRAIDEENWIFIDGLKRSTDPLRRIDKSYAPYKHDNYAPGLTWKTFCEFDDSIVNNSIGRTVRNEMAKMYMELADRVVWNNWFRPILNRDLQAGISYKLLNEVLKNNNLEHMMIKLFYPQQMREVYSKYQYVTGDKIVDYKIDGVRLVVVADPKYPTIAYDVRGRQIDRYVNTIQEYDNFAKHFLKEPMVFDGDVVSEEYYDLRKLGYSRDNCRITDGEHYVYDVLPWTEYLHRLFEQPLEERRTVLENTVQRAHELGYLTHTKIIKYKRMMLNTDTGEGMDELYEYLNKSLSWGHEGLVLKNPAESYKCYRSHAWLKLKPRPSVDLLMKRFEQNENHGGIRRIVCEGVDKDRHFIVNLGRGFKDHERQWFWENRESLVGKHIEIAGKSITPPTKIKHHWTVECPAYSRLRPDLDPPDEPSESDTTG